MRTGERLQGVPPCASTLPHHVAHERADMQSSAHPRVAAALSVAAKAAAIRGTAMPATLLTGPAGSGKTRLAEDLAAEIGATCTVLDGTRTTAHEIRAALIRIEAGDILVIDEIHGLRKDALEALLLPMESRKLAAPSRRRGSEVIDLPPWTLVGVTDQPDKLPAALISRFEHQHTLSVLDGTALTSIVTGAAGRMNISLADEAIAILVASAKGSPRLARQRVAAVADYSLVQGTPDGAVDAATTIAALELLGIDQYGLTEPERAVLGELAANDGAPVGLTSLAAAAGLTPALLQSTIEPGLVAAGWMFRSGAGRCATVATIRTAVKAGW